MIGNKFNYNDVFIRSVTIGLLDTFESTVKWTNRFENEDIIVDVPFYYSMLGNGRYLLDSFTDDIPSDVRLTELNVDVIPRGHITLNNINIKSEEQTNPNISLRIDEEFGGEIKKISSKIRAMPVRLAYSLEMKIESEIDIFKAWEAIMNTLWTYDYFSIEYKGMNIDCVVELPDEHTFQIAREENMSSDTQRTISIALEVHTVYPAYYQPKIDTDKLNVLKRTKWYSNIKKYRKD